MGQYHITVNLDKREFLMPHDLGDGLKLMEFGNSAGGVMTALAILLAVSNGRGGGDLHFDEKSPGYTPEIAARIGSWGGDRIAIVGDYQEEGDLPDPLDQDVYAQTDSKPWTNISADMRVLIESDGIYRFPNPGAGGWIQRVETYPHRCSQESIERQARYDATAALRPDMMLVVNGSGEVEEADIP